MSTWKLTVINCGKQVDLPLTAFQHGSIDEHIYANKCISVIELFYANVTPLTSARSVHQDLRRKESYVCGAAMK